MVMDFRRNTPLIVEYGLETQKTIDMLEAVYPSYVPSVGLLWTRTPTRWVMRTCTRLVFRVSAERKVESQRHAIRLTTSLKEIPDCPGGEKNVANTAC